MTDVVILINKKYYRHFWICFTLGSLESQPVFLHINCNAEVQDQEKYSFIAACCISKVEKKIRVLKKEIVFFLLFL